MLNKNNLIKAFTNGAKNKKGSNLFIDSKGNLYNYSTIIARYTNEGVILNKTKYSRTTSRNQNLIRYYGNVIMELEQQDFYKYIDLIED